MNEFDKEEVGEVFVILIVNEWDRIRNTRVFKCRRRVGNFKVTVMTCAARVCVHKSIGKEKKEGVPGGMKR